MCIGWEMPPSGAKLPTCWKMHRRASHTILMHCRGFSIFRRGDVASQRVAGPIGDSQESGDSSSSSRQNAPRRCETEVLMSR